GSGWSQAGARRSIQLRLAHAASTGSSPRRTASPTCVRSPIPWPARMPTSRFVEGMRVLIAEDDAGIRDLLHDLIERQGQAVTVARDGEEAWSLFKEDGADVIFSDWLMPRVEGPDLCRR